MAIRRGIKILLSVLIIFCLLFPSIDAVSVNLTNDPEVKSSDSEFPDKVYAFLAPSDSLTFEDLYFEKPYTYLIWVEIVTSHNCNLVITVTDPDGKYFDIFEADLTTTHVDTDYHEIPFGCAVTGNHTIEFTTISTYNLNLYIRVEKWIKCLHDKLTATDLQNMIYYDVTRFQDGMIISPPVELKTDYMYWFCFGRVSPIAATISDFVSVNFTLYDPVVIDYIIYTNQTMAPITGLNRIFFGTAIDGLYTMDIGVKSDVNYTNIAYAIIERYRISGIQDPNQTDPTNSTTPRNIFKMPVEWTVGLLSFFGVIITAVIVIVVKSKNRNIGRFKGRATYEEE
ncbi:MAG: hypothetical protein ACFFA3_10705 [Promethearchaeota archaeon]